MSKIARRTLWISRSRSKRASAESAGRVDRLDRGEVRALRGQLGEDGLAAPVAEQVVVLVEPERRAEDRVVADEPDEAASRRGRRTRRRAGPGAAAGAGRGSGAAGRGRSLGW